MEQKHNFDVYTVILNGIQFSFNCGYTMHEHLDEFGLINMNSRLYSPYLSRFLSPDPYIQDPQNSQNFNRYSYCLNNPLKYTDPSGEFWNLIVGGVLGGLSNWILNGCNFSWKGLGYFGVGALSGAVSSGIGSGVSSMLGGGTFGAGFLGTASAMTASSSFISGATIGGFSGSFGGSMTSLGNSLINGKGLGKSLLTSTKDGLIGGFSGGLLGGIGSGIDAINEERAFWNGESIKTTIYQMPNGNLPYHYQVDPTVGCTQETIESISEYKGNPILIADKTHGYDASILAKSEGLNCKTIANSTGTGRLVNISPESAGNFLSKNQCLAVTYDNNGTYHTVGINKIIKREYLKTGKVKYYFQVMNPLLKNRYGCISFNQFSNKSIIRVIW